MIKIPSRTDLKIHSNRASANRLDANVHFCNQSSRAERLLLRSTRLLGLKRSPRMEDDGSFPPNIAISAAKASQLRSILACPICDKVSVDPWSLIYCGHTFCRHCIEPFTNDLSLPPYCPQCHAMSMTKDPPREAHITGPIQTWAK